ncbi:3'-5' exonuclease [Sulfurimonas sp.]|jgi:DNA polymerase-3 subunit epsilon|uniref:3'-5' exonuclease n=1 Tax=Sulfurimonas sp. TaxID=2022749 RepID=UPI0025DC1149|nr:3'-5' exonuclease [Sulfurimonas sp.]MCK9472311.1 3'-5' exonuclease [Sulfurimonas sp.]
MLSNDFSLDAKSIHKLSSKGLSVKTLKEQINEDLELLLQLWHSQGLEILKQQGSFYFATKFIPLKDAEFCIVDIETNGSKIEKHQIIEIAALKIKDGKIIGAFDSLVHCKEINSHISEITGIAAEDTKDAPTLKQVMYDFKNFLADSVFIAHDVKFDYKFISQSMQKMGLAPLLNRSLCSLSLAERTIESYRYALSYLNEVFSLHPSATHHRAMSDVLTTYELFKLSLTNLDESIKSVEDIIKFSKEAKMLKRPKFDPLLKENQK